MAATRDSGRASIWRRRGWRLLGLLAAADLAAGAAAVHEISQKGRAFSADPLAIAVGDTVAFTNEDEFLHQIYVKSDSFDYESAEQSPGQTVRVRFTVPGRFDVQCEIHPKMHPAVTVQ